MVQPNQQQHLFSSRLHTASFTLLRSDPASAPPPINTPTSATTASASESVPPPPLPPLPFITKALIEEQEDVRALLDSVCHSSIPAEEREKRLEQFIKQLLELNKTTGGKPTLNENVLLKMAYVYRGKALTECNRREEALEEITKGESLLRGPDQPSDPVLFFEKGRVYMLLNQYSSAIRCLSKTLDEVLTGDPLYVEALITRAQCYSQIEEMTKALQDIGEAIFYQPDNLRARLERGRFLLNESPQMAIEEYENVLDVDGIDTDTQAEAYFRIGCAYLKKGEPDVAIRSLQQSQRLDPSHPRVSLLKEIFNELDEKIPKLMEEGQKKERRSNDQDEEEEEDARWNEEDNDEEENITSEEDLARKAEKTKTRQPKKTTTTITTEPSQKQKKTDQTKKSPKQQQQTTDHDTTTTIKPRAKQSDQQPALKDETTIKPRAKQSNQQPALKDETTTIKPRAKQSDQQPALKDETTIKPRAKQSNQQPALKDETKERKPRSKKADHSENPEL